MNNVKYVGMDIHKSITVIVVLASLNFGSRGWGHPMTVFPGLCMEAA